MKLLLTSGGLTPSASSRVALNYCLPRRARRLSVEMLAQYGRRLRARLVQAVGARLPTLGGFEAADAILVAGGNSGYLSYWFHQSGFADRLPSLLEKAIYVGVSAGSYVLTPGFNYDRRRWEEDGVYYDDEYGESAPPGAADYRGLGLVDFHLRPHLNSEDFPDLSLAAMARAAAKVDGPLYAIDDSSAIMVVDGRVEVISDGQWHLFNAPEVVH